MNGTALRSTVGGSATVFRLGDAVITRIEEVLEIGFAPSFLFPELDPSDLERSAVWDQPNFFDRQAGRFISSIHGWLIQVDGRTILVDTCSGNGKTRALPIFERFHMLDLPFIDNLARAGVEPEDVDLVVNTHLHIDHVGWNTRFDGASWVPAFPKARYVMGRRELAHWAEGGEGRGLFPLNVAVILDSVDPVSAAGLVDLVDDGDEIAPGLTVHLAPGHTATQLVVKYRGETASFICSADVLHQPIQVEKPEINSCFCEDPAAARQTRRAILEECATTGALLLPVHFGPPHAGFIRRAGAGYVFEPATPASGSPPGRLEAAGLF